MSNSYDYIVVGAGASGCILANRLSAASGNQVLLLEAGGSHERPEIEVPRNVVQAWGTAELDWGYVTTPQPGLNGREVPILRGKVLGGSSCLHALMYVRGNRLNYDNWGYLGCDGWDYESVLPYFRKIEDWERGDSKWRGAGGPMTLRCDPTPTEFALKFLDACEELGYRAGGTTDYNGETQENQAGLFQMTLTNDGRRASAAQAYLDPIRERKNLTISTGSMAKKIVLEGGKAVGVEYVKDGQKVTARAGREVILAGGTFDSPRLLMLSGIGPADHLKSVGIPVAVDLPGVGRNLVDHMLLPFPWHSKKPLPVPDFLAEAGIFLKTRSGMGGAPPNLQINVNAGVPSLAPPGIGDFFQYVIILTQPFSVGELRLRSSNPDELPLVDPGYLTCQADYDVLRAGIEFARKASRTRALAGLNGGSIPISDSSTEKEIEAYIRGTAQTIWHPIGTCRMGRDAMAVVDPSLRVYGVPGLRVADGAVMPYIPSGNTVAAVHMIGEKGADLILNG